MNAPAEILHTPRNDSGGQPARAGNDVGGAGKRKKAIKGGGGSDGLPPDPPPRTGPVFWAGIGVGIVLSVFGAVANNYAFIAPEMSRLLACAGIAIVLGAFGSAALVRYQGIVLTGTAGACIALYGLLTYSYHANSVIIDVEGVGHDASVALRGEHTFLSAPRDTVYQFVAFDTDLAAEHVVLTVQPASGSSGETIFDCISTAEIRNYFGAKTHLSWRAEMGKEPKLYAGAHLLSDAGNVLCGSSHPGATMRWPPLLSKAYAGTQLNIAQHIQDLNSEQLAVRSTARSSLAGGGTEIIKPVMQNWHRDPDNYRVKVGSVVSLTDMLREHETEREAAMRQLSAEDLHLLARAACDSDRTVRIYAGEFLYDLADPRLVPIALEMLPTTNDNGRYNLVLILTSVAPRLDASGRSALQRQVAQLARDGDYGERTRALIAKL